MATTKLKIERDVSGIATYSLPQSNCIYSATITAGGDGYFDVPDDGVSKSYVMRISVAQGFDLLISTNQPTETPVSPFFMQTSTEINIAEMTVYPNDKIYFTALNAGAVGNQAMVSLGLYANS